MKYIQILPVMMIMFACSNSNRKTADLKTDSSEIQPMPAETAMPATSTDIASNENIVEEPAQESLNVNRKNLQSMIDSYNSGNSYPIKTIFYPFDLVVIQTQNDSEDFSKGYIQAYDRDGNIVSDRIRILDGTGYFPQKIDSGYVEIEPGVKIFQLQYEISYKEFTGDPTGEESGGGNIYHHYREAIHIYPSGKIEVDKRDL